MDTVFLAGDALALDFPLVGETLLAGLFLAGGFLAGGFLLALAGDCFLAALA